MIVLPVLEIRFCTASRREGPATFTRSRAAFLALSIPLPLGGEEHDGDFTKLTGEAAGAVFVAFGAHFPNRKGIIPIRRTLK